jgi:hypothetical protein
MARFALEQAQQRHRNCHTHVYTLDVYAWQLCFRLLDPQTNIGAARP